MSKKKLYLTIVFIAILAVFAGIFSYPEPFNKGIGSFNNLKVSLFGFEIKVPHFPGASFVLGLDLQGGIQLIYEADLSNIEDSDKSETMEGFQVRRAV